MATRRDILAAQKAISASGYSGAPASSPAWGSGAAAIANSSGTNSMGWAAAYGQPSPGLPRPSNVFTDGAFGPLNPILPVPINTPPEGSDFAEPRLFENQVGWNLPVGTPGSEGVKLTDFSTLKTLADLYSVARACIQLRKNEIRGVEWDILPTRDASKAMRGAPNLARSFGARRSEAVKFFKRPDPDFFNWASFLDALCEEVFVYDALSILIRPKWARGRGAGLLGSDLDSISLLSGPTIRPLLGLHGERPRPPAPAYQQYLYGVPRVDLMSLVTERDLESGQLTGSEMGQFKADQLLYLPMTPRRWTPYGFPPIERALIPVMAGLQKQGFQLDYYREGSVPAVYISPGGANVNMTPNQIRELQDALNALAGDPAWKHKIIVLPADSKVMPQKQTQLADQFDEIVMNQVCVVPGTEIITKRGLVKIEDIELGDQVLTHKGRWRPVLAKFKNQRNGREMRKLTSKGLGTLEITADHKVWSGQYKHVKCKAQLENTGYVPAGALKSKDGYSKSFDALTIPVPEVGPDDAKLDVYKWVNPEAAINTKQLPAFVPMDRTFGRLLGYYLAEGHIAKNSNSTKVVWTFHKDEVEYHQQVVDALESVFGLHGGVYLRDERNVADINCYSKPLAELFSCGKAADKTLPEWAWEGSREFFEGILEGWINGDGCAAGHGQVRGSTASRDLAWHLRLLSLACGNSPSMRVTKARSSEIKGRVVSGGPQNVLEWKIGVKGASAYRLEESFQSFPLTSNEVSAYEDDVVWDLNVQEDHSYTSSIGTVSNCMSFDVQPMELGIMPKVSTTVSPGAANQMSKACYADGTQVLTRRGWLDFSEVAVGPGGDEFATRNLETKELEWQKATDYFEYNHEGEAIRFSSTNGAQSKDGGFQLLVSPNHRMLLEDAGAKKKDGSRPRVETIRAAEDIRAKRVNIPLRSKWSGNGPQVVKFDGFEWSAIDFAAFLGAYLAEGNCEKNSKRICLAQQEYSKGFEAYRALCARMFGDKCKYNGQQFRIWLPELWNYLNKLGHAHKKFVPRDVLDWSSTALQALLDHYLLGDGWLENGHWRARTVSKELADDLQEVAQKLGMYMTITENPPVDKKIQGRLVKAENCYVNYILRFGTRNTRSTLVSREMYTGVMRCVSVPNGIVYVRSGDFGVPAWCGNSQSIHERKATKPFLSFVADIMNVLLQEVCGQSDMRFMFEGLEEGEDEQIKTKILIDQVGSALRSIDEAREELDLQPWGLPETSDPGWASSTGWTPLTEAIAAARTGAEEGTVFTDDAIAAADAVDQGGPDEAGSSADSVSDQPGSPTQPGSMEDASPVGGVEVPNATPGHVASQAAAGAQPDVPLPTAKTVDPSVEKGNKRQERRAKLVEKYQDKVGDQLEQVVDRIRDGKIDRNKAVSLSVAFLTAGYKSIIEKAIEDAAEELNLDYTGHSSASDLAWKYGENQRQWLDGLVNTAVDKPDKKLKGRIGLYAQTLEAVYNKVFSEAAKASGKSWRITWELGPGENCDLCADRDGSQFTFDTLPGVPGEGVFGGDLCKGGPNCHCSLAFEEAKDKDTANKPQKDRVFSAYDLDNLHEQVAELANGRIQAAGKHPAQVLKPEDISEDDVAQLFASKTRAILSELEAMARHVRKGRAVSDWEPRHLTADVMARINEFMAKGADIDSAVQMVRRQRLVDSAGQVFWKDLIGDWEPGTARIGRAGGYEKLPHDENDMQFRPKGAASDLKDPNTVDSEHIVNMMLADFPAKALKWVADARWVGPIEVPLDRIDFDDVEDWAAYHEDGNVARFVKALKKGKKVKPGISVRPTGDDSRIKIVDGHHRVMAYKALGMPFVTYLGFVPDDDDRWEQTHSYQYAKTGFNSSSATVKKPDSEKGLGMAIHEPFAGVNNPPVSSVTHLPSMPSEDPSALQTEEELMNSPELIEFFELGQGAAQIKWGTTGDISRCVTLATQTMGLDNAQTFCQIRYAKMTGQEASGLVHGATKPTGGDDN